MPYFDPTDLQPEEVLKPEEGVNEDDVYEDYDNLKDDYDYQTTKPETSTTTSTTTTTTTTTSTTKLLEDEFFNELSDENLALFSTDAPIVAIDKESTNLLYYNTHLEKEMYFLDFTRSVRDGLFDKKRRIAWTRFF